MSINFNSGFTHSRYTSGQNNWPAPNVGKEMESPTHKTFNEEIKRQVEESFEVIKEDIKDTSNKSPYDTNNRRHNSDMKSFGEDEQEYFNKVMKSHWAYQVGNSLDHSDDKIMLKGSIMQV